MVLLSRRAVGLLIALIAAASALSWLPEDASRARSAAAPRIVTAVNAAQPAAPPSASNPLRNAYFGDLHVHTSWSLDAYNGGNRLNDPTVAYRYGRGEVVSGPNGSEQLRTPLDFMAVTDHDNMLGEGAMCADPSDAAYNTQICRDLRTRGVPILNTPVYTRDFRHHPEICGEGDQSRCLTRAADRWREIQANAQKFYQPGKFTTFSGYEWTGMREVGKYGAHLHRNVIFRGATVPEWGGSAVEMKHQPERLWAWLAQACRGECQVLTIPHNTNYSLGIALDTKNSDGTPFTQEDLTRRASIDRLVEIHQIKGNSECGVGVGTTDEDCNFEQAFQACKPGEDARCALSSDFVRNALKSGLLVEERQGVNPFKYGFIGSTDTHRSSAGATEESAGHPTNGVIGDKQAPFPVRPRLHVLRIPTPVGAGKTPEGWRPSGQKKTHGRPSSMPSNDGRHWHERNPDASALLRGMDVPGIPPFKPQFGRAGYKNGVPMGADLPSRPDGAKSPRFAVWASKDPHGANLQKVQVIKGWTSRGQTHEKVYDVACSDGLKADVRSGRCADNRATVNLSDCSVSSDKGAPELSATWTDPDFDSSERAFYYVRVLENPTCRWSMHRALATNSKLPDNEAAVTQERAWSSPIWYTPRVR